MYPGASSVPGELTAWVAGLQLAGVTSEIEVIAWGTPGQNLSNATLYELNHTWSVSESARLKDLIDEHPDEPMTVIGYSAGAAIAIWTTESLPAGYAVDRVVLLGADLSPGYDLTQMLDHTRDGGMHYVSPNDVSLAALTFLFGTMDQFFGDPAGHVGFTSTDSRFKQILWTSEMTRYGDFGSHYDYLFSVGFARDILAAWVQGL